MPTTTPNRALPVAALADVPDANVLANALALALDNVASIYTGTLATRGPATTTAGTAKGCPGTFYWAADVAQLSLSFGGAWIDLGGASAAPIPVGGSVDYTGNADPSDARWLLEDGRAISRTTYAALFALQGTSYGAGNGSTTFNLPDSRGRVTVGPDNMGTAAGAAGRLPNSANGRGNTGGEERHTLTITEAPSHDHGGQTGSALTTVEATSLAHTHPIPFGAIITTGTPSIITFQWQPGGSFNGIQTSNNSIGRVTATDNTTDLPQHRHTAGPLSISSAGGGGAHNNMQPYVVKNKIIRVL